MGRLSDATSPYLRQHADDPVDWRAWGSDAFAEARDSNRPIFLSSGYAACHWCHAMQAESFRNPETAALLNERFVPVKVDRESRPDVDALYMDYIVATTGSGGWPMTVFLTPDLVPLMGATYLPPEATEFLPSLTEVALAVDKAWKEDGDRLNETHDAALDFLREQAAPRQSVEFTRETLDRAAEHLLRWEDLQNGGFGEAPKFPQATVIEFLSAYYLGVEQDIGVKMAVERSLLAQIRGGIYDQVGGGLFRYSTDAGWRRPHFEKMLYDNGLLLSTLASASESASEPEVAEEYAYVARQTAAFMTREMAAPGGGFFSSLAADTEGEEGATYLWTLDQLSAALTSEQFALALSALGIEEAGADEAVTLTRVVGRWEHAEAVDALLAHLLELRAERPQPQADTKVLTSWNALAARGLIDAGVAFEDAGMVSLGTEALRAVLESADAGDGELRRDGADPTTSDLRLIEDHALAAAACLTAYEATEDPEWLNRARELQAATLRLFDDDGVLYMVPAVTELPVRPREQGDSPTPSGAATAAENAVRLAQIDGDDAAKESAARMFEQFWALADYAPEHACRALAAAVRLLG